MVYISVFLCKKSHASKRFKDSINKKKINEYTPFGHMP
jgi:hypothetical protein